MFGLQFGPRHPLSCVFFLQNRSDEECQRICKNLVDLCSNYIHSNNYVFFALFCSFTFSKVQVGLFELEVLPFVASEMIHVVWDIWRKHRFMYVSKKQILVLLS